MTEEEEKVSSVTTPIQIIVYNTIKLMKEHHKENNLRIIWSWLWKRKCTDVIFKHENVLYTDNILSVHGDHKDFINLRNTNTQLDVIDALKLHKFDVSGIYTYKNGLCVSFIVSRCSES